MEAETPEETPFKDPIDIAEFRSFKIRITRRNACDVTQTEPAYFKELKKYAVHRMDPRTATVIVESFYFTVKEAAQAAINYAQELQK